MRLWEVFRFEVGYQACRVSTWLYFTVLLALTYYMTREIGTDAGQNEFFTAPFVIATVTVLGSMMGLLVASALAGDAAARDLQTRVDPLLYTTRVTKAAYLGGRFLAAFSLYAAILLAVPLGLLLAAIVPGPASHLIGPFRPAAYLGAYFFFALPNAFVATALLFSMVTLSRHSTVSYLGSVLVFGAFLFSRVFVAGMLRQWELAKLLDPLGATVMSELSMVWTPVERSTRLITLPGSLLSNRLLWIGIALGVLTLTQRRFRLAHRAAGGWWNRRARRLRRDSPPRSATVNVVPEVRRTFCFATHARQLLAVARESLQQIMTSWGGLALAVMVMFVVVSGTQIAFMGLPLFATAERVTAFLTAPLTSPDEIIWLIVPLLIGFYAGELVWRERDACTSEITDAAPVPEWVAFLGKLVGLSLVLVVLQALMMGAGVLIQVLLGQLDFEIDLYARILFGLQLADYLLFAVLALVIHTLVSHKYVGHLVVVVAYALMAAGPALGIEHNLLLYGSDPRWTYSDMRGFEPFIGAWLSFKLYWAAWALFLAVVARLFWSRGKDARLVQRLRLARRRFTRPAAAVAAAAATLVLLIGGFIFYNTNVLNAYRTASDQLKSRAEYERRYGQYRGVPQPRMTGVTLNVEIYPQQRKAEIQGTYTLVNGTAVPIDLVHVTTASAVEVEAIDFDRSADLAVADEELNHRIYDLDQALQPGESLRLDFEVRFEPRGFPNRDIDASMVANGSYFTSRWLPAIGYQMERELRTAGERRAYGLAARPEVRPLDDPEARHDARRAARIALEAIVGTDVDQVAVAPGRLRRTWTENRRRYFHYSTDAPIRNDYAFFSAAYAVQKARWRDVSIEILHHPGHAWNVKRMARSVQASLGSYTKRFGPYPHGQIRLVEHPGDATVLHAAPINISYDEAFSLLNPDSDPRDIDFPFAVVAHEVAHQWWGHTLMPAEVEGAALLTESLAWYSALGVVEQTFGPDHLQRLLNLMREIYLTPRTRANVPLLRARDSFLAYRKGPFAMHALREYVGAERVDAALRRLLEKHASGMPPLPTSVDLYRELEAVTPDALHYLLVDLFEVNTFWDLATQSVSAERTERGAWRVTLDVRAHKVVVDTAAAETEAPMDDLVEIGLFAEAEDGRLGTPLYLRMHRVRSGQQQIIVTVPSQPAQAGIDPRNLLIDVKTDDNLQPVS